MRSEASTAILVDASTTPITSCFLPEPERSFWRVAATSLSVFSMNDLFDVASAAFSASIVLARLFSLFFFYNNNNSSNNMYDSTHWPYNNNNYNNNNNNNNTNSTEKMRVRVGGL